VVGGDDGDIGKIVVVGDDVGDIGKLWWLAMTMVLMIVTKDWLVYVNKKI